MKKSIRTAILFSLLHLVIFGQNNDRINGIYKTGEDLIEGRVSWEVDCDTKTDKIKLNDFFSRSYITVKLKDSSYKLLKKDIYGFRKCNGQVYRFHNKQELLLLNLGENILIYHHVVPRRDSTSRINVTNYYFSVGVNAPVQTLTIQNLKNAYPQNMAFHSLLDKNFTYNTDLVRFDKQNKQYTINLLLGKTE